MDLFSIGPFRNKYRLASKYQNSNTTIFIIEIAFQNVGSAKCRPFCSGFVVSLTTRHKRKIMNIYFFYLLRTKQSATTDPQYEPRPDKESHAWWRHQMETFSALLALCAGNSSVNGAFPSQRPVMQSFDVSLICAWTKGWVNNREVIWDAIALIMTSLWWTKPETPWHGNALYEGQ